MNAPRTVLPVGLLLGLAAAAAAAGAASVQAQPGQREVYVTVLDSDGVPITGMTAEYFAVREDGRDRAIVSVQPLDTPMHVAVIVDTSQASKIAVTPFRTAVTTFVERLAASHLVGLYTCGDRASRVTDFTQDAGLLREAVLTAFGRSSGAAFLLDGVDLAVEDVQRLAPRRPVVVVISTESPEGGGQSAGSVVKKLIERSVSFHAVVLASATGSGQGGGRLETDVMKRRQAMESMIALGEGDRERTQLLEQGTSSTAGSIQRVASLLALEPALVRLTNELVYSYRLTFATNAKSSKNLQVGVLLDGVTVRAIPAPR